MVPHLTTALTGSLMALQATFLDAAPDVDKPTTVNLPKGTSLLLEPLVRIQCRLGLKDFDPCAILLSNNLTEGIPEILKDLNEQFVLTPLHTGRALRRKSNHFAASLELERTAPVEVEELSSASV